MNFVPTKLDGVFHIEAEPATDDRGRFTRVYCVDEFAAQGIKFRPVQSNLSQNISKGTLRGMHFQLDPHGEQKLVRCSRGRVFDVAVDLRPASQTYLQWVGQELSAIAMNALFIPEGFAQGFITLEDNTEITYLMGSAYVPDAASGVRWDDPALGIEWPIEPSSISERDLNWPAIEQDL